MNFISFRDVLTACLQLDDLKGKKKKKGKKKIEPLDTSTIGEDVYKVPQEQEISISGAFANGLLDCGFQSRYSQIC